MPNLSDKIKNSSGQLVANDLTMDYVLERIKLFDNISKDDQNTQDSVNHVKTPTQNNTKVTKPTGKFNPNIVCYNCAGFGHLPKACASPKRPLDFMPDHLKVIMDKRSNKQKILIHQKSLLLMIVQSMQLSIRLLYLI